MALAQAIIEVAHPEDRRQLMELAKEKKLLYADQIFLKDNAVFYPSEIATKHVIKNGTVSRFRAIKPSDEEGMRRLFYKFSDEAVYYRYFSPIKTMPHAKMQEYVNVDFSEEMSIVGVAGEAGIGTIIAEARFVRENRKAPSADVAFVVDEKYQGFGVATYMLNMLIRLAKERGVHFFTADVLSSNIGMMKVFERNGTPLEAKLQEGGII